MNKTHLIFVSFLLPTLAFAGESNSGTLIMLNTVSAWVIVTSLAVVGHSLWKERKAKSGDTESEDAE